jgi:hypothetical protein
VVASQGGATHCACRPTYATVAKITCGHDGGSTLISQKAAFIRRADTAFLPVHFKPQDLSDPLYDTLVDALRTALAMVHVIKERFDIEIDNPGLALVDISLGRFHGIVRASFPAEPVAALAHSRVKDRVQHCGDLGRDNCRWCPR